MTKAAQDTKHLAAPWRVSRMEGRRVALVNKYGGLITYLDCKAESAHATLIASAPDLLAAIQPILAEYAKRDPIGDSELYDEQPVHITVTLGDLRRLARIRT